MQGATVEENQKRKIMNVWKHTEVELVRGRIGSFYRIRRQGLVRILAERSFALLLSRHPFPRSIIP